MRSSKSGGQNYIIGLLAYSQLSHLFYHNLSKSPNIQFKQSNPMFWILDRRALEQFRCFILIRITGHIDNKLMKIICDCQVLLPLVKHSTCRPATNRQLLGWVSMAGVVGANWAPVDNLYVNNIDLPVLGF
jgi:hypothetical protein